MRLRTPMLMLMIIMAFQGFSQNISFFAEDLKFDLNDDRFEVDGLYHFRNNTAEEIRQMLFYPFPDTEVYGSISHVSIHPADDTTNMLSRQNEDGCLFKLKIPPNEEVVYRIGYRQQLKANKAKYIITSTQAWEAPFETAKFQLAFPKDLQTLTSSIPPDSIASGSENVTYFWNRKNFMPDRDFEFEFKTK